MANVRYEDDARLQAAIIRGCSLSNATVADIIRVQAMLGLSFREAAIRLGHVSQTEVDSATKSHQRLPVIRTDLAQPAQDLLLVHQPDHPRSEQIRTLRTELLLRHESDDSANIMAVLSPSAGEGRSQLAAELAIAFAQLGRPTLLVDADLRNPRQHQLFSADGMVGLSQALVRDQKPNFQGVAGIPTLSLLSAGVLPHNPLELLSDRRFEALVREWQGHYEFVVLDTPPVSQYADGLAVATIVGRVLSLSRAGHTSYRDSRAMMRRLAATRSRVLGAVINYF